jgi:fibrillarin-like rRNA methylase
MANLVPKSLYLGNSTGSNVYTVANTAGNYTIIKAINICNTSDTANAKADIHILINGAAPSANNKVVSNANVIKNDVLYYNTSIVVPANSNVYVGSSNSSITFNISGVEYA